MNNKDMRGAIIRGAMAMQTPVIIVFFKECCADDFQANWDDLTSGVQQFWIELAEQLEGIIGSELWKTTIEDQWEKPSDCAGKKCKHFGRCNHGAGDDCFEKKPLPSFEFRPCPYEDKLCPICKLELKPCPSGWSCANGHGY